MLPSKHRKFFSRSASLKQAATTSSMSSTQTSMELHVPGHSSASGAGSPAGGGGGGPQTQPSTPKKSNWEVIEHFNTSNVKGGKAMVSSSLIAVSCCQLIGDQQRGTYHEQGRRGQKGRRVARVGQVYRDWHQLICSPNGQSRQEAAI